MPKDKQTKGEDGAEQMPDADSSSKSSAGESAAETGSEKEPRSLDLDKLKKTTTTQAPPSTIAGTVRTRVVASTGPKMDWKFSIIAGVASMFLAFFTHIFGINGGLVLNDRFNLSFLTSQTLMGKISEKILMDMLGVAPLSQPWLRASLIADQGEYKFAFIWYHSVQVFWHALATGLLFFFVLTVARHLRHQNRSRLDPYLLATACAGLFACHPFSCEAVSYISARSALLGTVNFFESLFCLLLAGLVKQPVARGCFTAIAVYAGAMSLWSNPESILLPAAALFSLFLMKRPLANWKQTLQEHPFLTGMGAALSIGVPCLVLLPVQYTTAINLFMPTLSPLSYFASQIKALVFYYLRCYCLPLGLSIDPPLAVAGGFTDPFVLVGALVLGGLAYLVIRFRHPVLSLAGVLVLAGFLPHIFMVQPDAVADWVAYLPLGGMMLFVSSGLCYWAQRDMTKSAIALGCLLVLFCSLSIFRDFQWGSNYTLFESGLSLRPKSAFLHANMAMEYLKRDEVDDAEKEAKLAVDYGPGVVICQLAQAKVKMARGKFEEAGKILTACQSLAESQKLSPEVKAECRFGELQCLIGARKEKEANELLAKLLTEFPEDGRLFYAGALAAYQMQAWENAFTLFNKALGTNPTLIECWQPMTVCALSLRANDTAYQTARMYAEQVGGPNANLLLARACMVSSHEKEAEDILKQMVQANPKNARALYVLSRLYKRLGKSDDWKLYRDQAIKVDPDIAIRYELPELDMAESAPPPGETEEQPAPAPAAPAPVSPAPVSPAPVSPAPVTSAPVTSAPVSSAPEPAKK
jgi:tetratricopeptide (TPR) repeat protein